MTTRGSLNRHPLDWFSLLVGLITVVGAAQAQYMSWGQSESWSVLSYLIPSALVVLGISGLFRGRRGNLEQEAVEQD